MANPGNYRIMCWLKGSKIGSIVVGEYGKGDQSNQIDYSEDLSFDREDNLSPSLWFIFFDFLFILKLFLFSWNSIDDECEIYYKNIFIYQIWI